MLAAAWLFDASEFDFCVPRMFKVRQGLDRSIEKRGVCGYFSFQ
jgi:hypothetical protein